MIHPTSHRFASPAVTHRVLDSAFASAFSRRVSSSGSSRRVPLHPSQARRRGQALLIAVLLMVFAAVLGATFVTVVALNLSQTARSGSVNTARVAAVAGRNYINDQLTNSPRGERWNPIDNALPPAPGDPDFTYYYNDYERAQGWTRTTPHPPSDASGDLDGDGVFWPTDTDDDRIAVLNDLAAGGSTFAKFPDPRSTSITGNNTPTFLAKVEIANSAVDPNVEPERNGQLKVTVIGRASDNDAASSTLVFYKPTTQNGNITSFARYDSNWSFRSGKTLTTQLTADIAAGDTLEVADVRGFTKGMTVILGSGATVTYNGVIADIVSSPTPDTPNGGTLKLATMLPLVPVIKQGTLIRLSSPYMGGLSKIDANGTENPIQDTDTPSEYQDVLLAGEPASGGIMVNNGMYFVGKSRFALKTTGSKRDQVLVGGPISIDSNAAAEVTDGTAIEDIKNTTTLKDYVRYQQSEENDPTSRTQAVRPITPARLDLPNSRWLQVTKLSDINNGSQFGYGFGVYIDNREDFEAVQKNTPNSTTSPTAVTTTFRKMTISQILRLLQRKSLPADPLDLAPAGSFVIDHTLPDTSVKQERFDYSPGNTDLQFGVAPDPVGYRNADPSVAPVPSVSSLNTFNRLSFARIGVDTYDFPIRDAYADQPFRNIGSLEQRGLRGCISPYEFLPRGVSVELRNNDIIITRDDLSDAPEKIVDVTTPIDPSGYEDNPKYNHPDENKAWRNIDGKQFTNNTPLTVNNPGPRVYRMRINITTGQRFVGAPNNEALIATKEFNGVIYAEGNVRVRGISDKDVTIVSMGTIYIEGGINKTATGGHVALLAKRNAVLNPTQFAARPAGLQMANLVPGTVIQTSPTPSTGPFVGLPDVLDKHIDVPVFETSGFRIGDRVTFGAQPETWVITKVSIPETTRGLDGPGTISLANPGGLTLNANYTDRVVIVDDAALTNGASQKAYNVGNFARDLLRDGGTNVGIYQLGIVHAGQLEPGIEIKRQTPATDANTIDIKKDTTLDDIIKWADGEKQIVAGGPTGVTFDLATAPTNTLGGLRDSFTSLTMPTPPDPNPNWDMTLVGGTSAATSSHRLAAISTANIDPLLPRKFLLTTSVGGYWNNSATPNFIVGSGFDPRIDPEELRTVQEQFYGRYNLATNTLVQADLQGMGYLLPTAPLPNGDNTIALRRTVTTDSLATDLVANIKYDRDTFANVVASPINVNVQATIYVQDGSWFVIPMPALTPRPFNPAAPTPVEVAQAEKYRRLNYQITVKANIAENFAPTGLFDYDNEQTPDQSATPLTQGLGAQAQWLDSSAYPVAGAKWQSINYIAPDPLPLNNTLYLPVTPDIIDQR